MAVSLAILAMMSGMKGQEQDLKIPTCRFGAWLLLIGSALFSPAFASAQEITPETLVERQKIQDLITSYYYNFGGTPESFANFFVQDGELIVIGRSFKGREAIARAYTFPGGEAPKNFSFNSLISNLLIKVEGDTATAKLVWTENVVQKERDPVQQPFQGREYSTFVKVAGKWMYRTRELKGGTEAPEGWGASRNAP
jgi:hypothetical protein